MNFKVLLSTFVAVFVAELGDKTQLATMSLSAGAASKWAVFAGSALALVTTSAIAVLAGAAVTRVVPPHWLRRIAGAVFIALGVLKVTHLVRLTWASVLLSAVLAQLLCSSARTIRRWRLAYLRRRRHA